MKKFLSNLMVAFAIMATVACNKEKDDPVPQNYCVDVISINTATLYNTLGITELMTEKLAEGGTTVSDSVLVYDQQGKLVARKGAESTSLQTVSISLGDLPDGTYTLVAWQTTNNGPEPFWPLVDADNIATARIVQAYPSTINVYRAIGMYTATVTVGSGTGTLDAEMEPMGSVVDLSIDGLTSECDYKNASLVAGGESPAVDGFYLSPARSGEDRWVFSDSRLESDRAIGGVLPSKPDSKVFTLSHGEKKTLWLCGINKGTNEKDSLVSAVCSLQPGTVATFYYNLDKTGYQPPYCGPTADFAAWKAQRDAGILDAAPCLLWGADLQTVHDYVVSHHQWWQLDYEELDLEEGHGWCRWYNIAKNLFEYYCFETENGNNLLATILICFDPSDESLEAAWTTLEHQGYELLGGIIYPDQPDVFYYLLLSADGNTEACLNIYDDGGWQIFYQVTDPDDLAHVIPING